MMTPKSTKNLNLKQGNPREFAICPALRSGDGKWGGGVVVLSLALVRRRTGLLMLDWNQAREGGFPT
jgi:hypothetical protein